MSHKFNVAIRRTLAHEGGYVNDSADPGGATNYGISLRWYRDAVEPEATAETIRSMSRQKAHRLYQEHFWKPEYDRILDEDVAAYTFDMAVNMGHKQAHFILQRALAACGEPVEEDGVIGPVTVAAVNRANPEALLAALKATRAEFYRHLVARKPSMEKFLRGWLRRAYHA